VRRTGVEARTARDNTRSVVPSKKKDSDARVRSKLWALAIELDSDRSKDAEAIDVLLAVAAYLAPDGAAYSDGHERRAWQRDETTREAIGRAWQALYGRSLDPFARARRRLLDKIERAQWVLDGFEPGDPPATEYPDQFVKRMRTALIDMDPKFARLTAGEMRSTLVRRVKKKRVSVVDVAAAWLEKTNALDARGRSKADLVQSLRDVWGRARARAK
jgi:hypothetical protein